MHTFANLTQNHKASSDLVHKPSLNLRLFFSIKFRVRNSCTKNKNIFLINRGFLARFQNRYITDICASLNLSPCRLKSGILTATLVHGELYTN